MIVEVQVTIGGSRAATWAAITDIGNHAKILSGVEGIEIVAKPTNGFVGMRWRETRMLFGKPATVEKWITEATEHVSYKTRAEDSGFIFLATLTISEGHGGKMTLTSSHESLPQNIGARLSIPIMFLFKGVTRKALRQDLNDLKAVVERT